MIKLVYNSLIVFLMLLPATLFAETEVSRNVTGNSINKAGSIETFSMMNMLNMVMGLVVVIALILGLAWVLKKYGRLPNNNLVDMKVLGGLSLGTREKALLIEVENTRLLVGVTPGHIQTLYVLDNAEGKAPPSFNETLTKVVEKIDE